MEDKDFNLVNLPEACKDPEIKKEDFTLQQADQEIHEQKFQTKPTTFLKDSLRRFRKNKSSVVAAYILGFLIALSIIVPFASPHPVNGSLDAAYKNLEPKLFDNNGGFWDGTIKVNHVPVDISNPDPETWLPDENNYHHAGIVKETIKYEDEQFTNMPTSLGREGFVQIGYFEGSFSSSVEAKSYIESHTPSDFFGVTKYNCDIDLDEEELTLSRFITADEDMIKNYSSNEHGIPKNFVLGESTVEFVFIEPGVGEKIITLVDPKVRHDIGEGEAVIPLNDIIKAQTDMRVFSNCSFRLTVYPENASDYNKNVCGLVKEFVIQTSSVNPIKQAYFSPDRRTVTTKDNSKISVVGISFTNAMEMASRTTTDKTGLSSYLNVGYWTANSDKYFYQVYLGKAVFASFTYDPYYAAFGPKVIDVPANIFTQWTTRGYIEHGIEIDYMADPICVDKEIWEDFCFAHDGKGIVILNKGKCPIVESCIESFDIDVDVIIDEPLTTGYVPWYVRLTVTNYKYLGHSEMPKYLFGTDKSGYDMFKYVFEGLRNSLALGVLTFIVCFLFGLLWGSISGYFGGTVDLVMERVTDILSGLPWIVLMTLIILNIGQTFAAFALALCLTGWIGTASTTRTQFYRFRGREYVLASRTLGASDARLIAKHILPNAMGTIITGAVLMIPSVIFSEATISYLGLGFKGLSSLGVILSNNQAELVSHPYQLLFPSVIIALVMISFNLFGNGLRDAINPSLKGEDE